MKKRARIVSGLAALGALAALFLAPLAEASLSRVSTAERAIEAPALTLASHAPEPSEFSLFEGTELTAAAAESERAPSFHPLAAVSLLSKNEADPPLVSVDELIYPKTRYRLFDFLGAPLVGVERGVSLELHWGCASFSCGLSSGTVGWLSEDPLGDRDSVNLYGFVGMRPHEKTDPLGLLGLVDVPGIAWDTFTGIFDPRNAWKNAQRGAGGVVGAGKFVGKTVVGAGSLVIDVATMSVDDAAADRMVARGQGVWAAASHPLDAVVNAHSDAFNKILEHEQKGEYFSSGVEAGETGVADAAAITGAYGAVRGVVGAVSRATSFGGLTKAAGAGLTDFGAEARFLEWKSGLAMKNTPGGTAQGLFEIRQTGRLNYRVEGGGESLWADGLQSPGSILEAKYVVNPARSPFISGSDIPAVVRGKIVGQVRGEFRRMGAIIGDPSNPISRAQVITNSAAARPFFESLLKEFGIPGEVVIGK